MFKSKYCRHTHSTTDKTKIKRPRMNSIPDEDKCLIHTKDGPVLGYKKKSEGKILYKFKSIPYAKPPVEGLRFLPPVPIQPWDEVKDCTKRANLPFTIDIEERLLGSEDCLYIIVSSPNIKPDKPLPVMFWIGCYCFAINADYIYDSSYLTAQDIVFVRCGYRMGPFGFLSFQNPEAPGNCGLKDIVLALRWVQRNISLFGGDPKNVTLFGNSAGGAIVHFMMFSPMATGLFHKAIMQSASALNNWSLDKNPSQSVLLLTKLLGIDKICKSEIVDELKKKSAIEIMEAFKELKLRRVGDDVLLEPVFKPCIEIEFEGQSAFLTKNVASLIKSGAFNKVPLLIGSNNIEAAILEYKIENFYEDFQKYNENAALLVPKPLGRAEDLIAKSIGQQLVKFYMAGEEQLRKDTKTQFLQIISDYHFLYYVNRTVRLHTQFAPGVPVYYYIMNYAGSWSVPKNYNFINSMGHSAEMPFIFGFKFDGPICKGSRDCVKTRSRVVKLWTNFAKYGNPTPDDEDPLLQITWDPVESIHKLNYLNIGSELTKGRNPYQERMEFWDNLHRDHTFLRTLVHFNDLGVQW